MGTTESDGPLTRLLVRFATHPDGSLRGERLLGLAFLGGLVTAVGTTAALVAADAGNPATLSIWVIVSFLAIKLPLLGLLWWVLGRRQREDVLTEADIRAMVDRLESATSTALRTPDAADRLTILREEARYVEQRAGGDLAERARSVGARIDVLLTERTV